MNGQERFYNYYKEIYKDRWPALFKALQEKPMQVSRTNLFINSNADMRNPHPEITNCSLDTNQPERNEAGLLSHYIMDPASVVVAQNIPVLKSSRILDMCAAPGGKSLVLAEKLDLESKLICNELSAPRRARLTKVIQQYIPRNIRDQIWVTGKDAVQFGLKEPNSFDVILLDAPCSGERHLLETPEEISGWKEKRTQSLAQKQYSLACAALLALKSEGHLMYSTCSISPLENDGLISKIQKKKSGSFKVIDLNLNYSFLEKTEHGYQILPDKANGMGPMYFCLLQKQKF